MSGFESIIGQQRPIRLLQRFAAKAMIPHALLFTGIAGVGKRTTARLFAMALNCSPAASGDGNNDPSATGSPCGRCRSCRRIADGNHPDVIEVSPRKGVLRIDQIREVIGALTLKPFGDGMRVVIVAEAHAMNTEAGNALLKLLEEPPAGTILILTALQSTDLLPTIASRCRHIRFNPLCSRDSAALLMATRPMDVEMAETIAQMAGGSYTRALQLAQSRWSDQRDWVVGAAGLDHTIRTKQRTSTLCLAFAAQMALRKEQVENDLEILKTWIRDLSIWPYQPERVINRDRRALLQETRAGIDDRRLSALWEAVEKAQKGIAANGNLRLTLDVMALHMAEILRPDRHMV